MTLTHTVTLNLNLNLACVRCVRVCVCFEQSPDHDISLERYTFNTEAHPLSIFKTA